MVSLNFLPLVLVGILVGVLAFATLSERADRFLSKTALATFGFYLDLRGDRPERARLLQAAYQGTPYRVYAAKTLLYSVIAMVVGSVLGVYLASGILLAVPAVASSSPVQSLPIPPNLLVTLRSVPSISAGQLFTLLLISSVTVGVISWFLTFKLRWWMLAIEADNRRRRIDLSMPRMIALMYALVRGGLEFPRILQILSRHRAVYGEAANEMAVASRSIDVFGIDTVTAIRQVASRTPSDQFRVFAENLASVLQSGRSIPEFFQEQYEQYQEEAEVQQELFLDRLGAIAEAYVALLVVGPLFILTVLLIFGLISGGTKTAIQAIVYLLMPLLNIGFISFLDLTTEPMDITRVDLSNLRADLTSPFSLESGGERAPRGPIADGGAALAGGEAAANAARLQAFDRFQSVRSLFTNPIGVVRSRPITILYAAIPLGALWMAGVAAILQSRGELTIPAIDEYVVQGLLIISIPFAIARYVYTNRLQEIENVVPDMFNRLASLNESGIEIVNAFKEIRHGDLGVLTPELQRIWTDIEFGLDVERALYRFEARTRAPSISRAVTLITNGVKASGNIGPVLRIAADESRRLNALKRERASQMSIYLIIIYLSFIVFLSIIFVLVETFIPAIPAQESLEGAGLAGAAAGISQEQAAAFTVILFHASIIQAVFSGLIAGQMSKGSLRDGAIHVVVMILLAYGVFAILT